MRLIILYQRRARIPIGNGVAPFMVKSAKASPHTHTAINY
jgi:hypothetical protein